MTSEITPLANDPWGGSAAAALAVTAAMLDSIGRLTESLIEDCTGGDAPILEAILACVEKGERAVGAASGLVVGPLANTSTMGALG